MKRLTLFAAALMVAVGSFAEIAYNLDGGKTNDYGWTTPQDMYATLNADFNAFKGTDKQWTPLDTLIAKNPTNLAEAARLAIPTEAGAMDMTFTADAKFQEHFAWLMEYIEAEYAKVKAGASFAADATETSAVLRYTLSAFFFNTTYGDYRCPINWATTGVSHYDAYVGYWKAAYANPTAPTAEFVLNAPYKEGATFDGWYASADFSGEKVTKVDATTTGTLYAKWIEYIPTIAEICAEADDAAVKAKAVCSQAIGDEFWLQDASGAILCYLKGHSVKVGELVTLKGKKITYQGYPEIKDITIEKQEAGTPVVPDLLTGIAAVTADTAKYMSHLVKLQGARLKFVQSGEYTDIYANDGTDSILCYKLKLDAATYQGVKVDIVGTIGIYNGKLQLRSNASDVTIAVAGLKDSYEYPARGDSAQYTLKNEWLITNVLNNYASNKPGNTNAVRGMAAKGGIMYFVNNELEALVRVDGKTGNMLENVKFGKELFTHTYKNVSGQDSVGYANVVFKFNDIKIDNAGHLLVGPCITSSAGMYQIWKIDENTGAGTLVLEEVLAENPDNVANTRIDYFGVYGDVDNRAIIMAQDYNNMIAYKWVVENGKQVGKAEAINLAVEETDDSYLVGKAVGSLAQIFPVDENYFYTDGFESLPTLFNMNGTFAEDFKSCPTGLKVVNNPGDTTEIQGQQNGLAEFSIGADRFLVCACNSTAGNPAGSLALFQYEGGVQSFAALKPLWYFPAGGIGSGSSTYRALVPYVDVDEAKGLAKIYFYAGENGYGVYTFQGVAGPVEDGVENITTDENVKVQKIMENGQVIIIRDGVRYNVLGTQVK